MPKPPADSVRRAAESALPAWVIAPRFIAGAKAYLEPMPKARAFMSLVEGAFNYNVYGRDGFATVARLVDGVDCYQFTYSRLEDAVQVFAELKARDRVQ